MPTLKSSSSFELCFSSLAQIELNGSIRGRFGAGTSQCRSIFRRMGSDDIGAIFSALYLRSLLSETETVELVAVVAVIVCVTDNFLGLLSVNDWFKTFDSTDSALRFRLKLVSVVNREEVVELDDESNVLLVENFEVERNDEDDVDDIFDVVSNKVDGLLAVLNRFDENDGVDELLNIDDDNVLDAVFVKIDDDNDDDDDGLSKLLDKLDENKLGCLVALVPDKIEFVGLLDDADETLEPCNSELL